MLIVYQYTFRSELELFAFAENTIYLRSNRWHFLRHTAWKHYSLTHELIRVIYKSLSSDDLYFTKKLKCAVLSARSECCLVKLF
jgi:hypothetical protein